MTSAARLTLLFGAVALLLAICGNVSILRPARGTLRPARTGSVLSLVEPAVSHRAATPPTESRCSPYRCGPGRGDRVPDAGVHRGPRAALIFFSRSRFPRQSACAAFQRGPGRGFGRSSSGVFPALEAARHEINHVIQAGSHKMAGSVRGKRMYSGLIAGDRPHLITAYRRRGAAIPGGLPA